MALFNGLSLEGLSHRLCYLTGRDPNAIGRAVLSTDSGGFRSCVNTEVLAMFMSLL